MATIVVRHRRQIVRADGSLSSATQVIPQHVHADNAWEERHLDFLFEGSLAPLGMCEDCVDEIWNILRACHVNSKDADEPAQSCELCEG